jgi:hypothetical protein
VVAGITEPAPGMLEQLPSASYDPRVPGGPQPVIHVGIMGGALPALGRCMVDTGSGFTLTSTLVCRDFGL